MEKHLTEKLTAGCLPVPLFNQKKRSRLPLTSNPSKNEFVLDNEYPYRQSFGLPSLSSAILGSTGFSEVHRPGPAITAIQRSQWSRQGYPNRRPLESSPARGLAPIPYPRWSGHMGSSGESRWKSSHSRLQTDQQSYRLLNPQMGPSPQKPGTQTATLGNQQQSSVWRSTSISRSSQIKGEDTHTFSKKITPQPQKPAESPMKTVMENSLRILTVVIEGMKHWSRFKDRVPILFEVFATLDSAVTIGNHGAKNFLLRDGQDVVQCVFYETDQDLPRLIRGQLHRCVGNYDRGRDLLTCMSIRHASSSEQRNAQEAVRASDAEMRRLVTLSSEV